MNDFILKWGLLVLSFIGFGCIYFFFNVMRSKEDQDALSPEDVSTVIAEFKDKQLDKEALQKRNQLIEDLFQLKNKIAICKSQRIYQDLFFNYASFYQYCIGLMLYTKEEGLSSVKFSSLLNIKIINSGISKVLTKNGFFLPNIQRRELSYDITKSTYSDIELDILELEVEKAECVLAELQKKLNYKKILAETGTLLYQILELTDREEMKLILPKVEKISHILYENGCYALFADDKRVLASEELQVDFLAVDDEIEIPGFYSFVDGKYELLGDCQGMKKEKMEDRR